MGNKLYFKQQIWIESLSINVQKYTFDPIFNFTKRFLKMSQQVINTWLDCDPGLDDTLALLMAAHHDRLNLIGVSTSAGNTSL